MPARPPRLWCFLGQTWLGLPPHATAGWWQTLSRAQSPKAVVLRTTLLYHEGREETLAALEHLVRQTLSPQGLVDALEALVDEHQLSRAHATQIEEAIFRQTAATGEWKDEPAGRPARSSA